MTTQIKTLRENVIKALSGIKEDNVSIAGIAIHRKTLLEALKLQTDDRVTIQYGKLSWDNSGFSQYADRNGARNWHESIVEPEQAIQITCGRAVMRFLNRPHQPRRISELKEPVGLNFVSGFAAPITDVKGIPFDTRELIEALTYVLPCVATEESRPVLQCVCFDSKDGVLTLAAADGFRLGIAKMTVKGLPDMRVIINAPHDISRLLVFLKHIKPLGRGKAKYYPEAHLTTGDKAWTFSAYTHGISGEEVELPLQVGSFPEYSQLIPQAGTQIEFIASDFLEAVKALAPYCKDGSGIIRMEFKREELLGRVRLSARSEELGESSTEVDANVAADCRIAANHTYLEALLKLCGDNTITMLVTTPSSPMVFETGKAGNRTTVVMPMFVAWSESDVKREPEVEKPEEEIETPEEDLEPVDTEDPRDLVESEQM